MLIKQILQFAIWCLLFFNSKNIVGQTAPNTLYDSIYNSIRVLNFPDSLPKFPKESGSRKHLLKFQYNLLKNGLIELDSSYLDMNYGNQDIYTDFLKGDYLLELKHDNNADSLAYEHYLQAFEKSKTQRNIVLECESLKRILKYHFKNQQDFELFYDYAKKYRDIAYDDFEKANANYYYIGSLLQLEYHLNIVRVDFLSQAIPILIETEHKDLIYLSGRISQIIGIYYDLVRKDYSKAIDYYLKALSKYSELPFFLARKNTNDMLFNIGALELERNNIKKSLSYLTRLDMNSISKRDSKDKILIYDNLYRAFKKGNRNDSAIFYLEKKYQLNDSLELNEKAKGIAELETRYQTTEKEKQILIEKQQKEKNRNIALGLAGLLVFGSLIFFLIQKNTSKKQKLAEQQQLIEQQKVATLLKEQELVSIDAMIAGQEKERTKVANELHDDLGSLMATVKLHFDNVKVDQKDPALQNAQRLLDEAYQKIRSMAHSKNSGVMANQGLLPAVKKMSKTINETNALELSVEDFGLGERMENLLELAIFRIIQELVANIIKHAEATKATIQFTQHEDNLNIIVEDNGKGFNMTAVKRNQNGMGLGTIEKRIEHLEGSFTVDSIQGKGTSILIDIPI